MTFESIFAFAGRGLDITLAWARHHPILALLCVVALLVIALYLSHRRQQ